MTVDPKLAEMFPESIEFYVNELATSKALPPVAVAACLARPQEAAPLLRRLLLRATDNGIPGDSRAEQLFRALHILGGMRDAQSFLPLLRFLQGPRDDLDRFLGDASTETLSKIVAGVFDGNAEALFGAACNREVEGSIRGALVHAATFVAWQGHIDRTAMAAFLERFAAEPSTPGDELTWLAWSDAIALLGFRHLEPLVSEAEKSDRLEDGLFDREKFEAVLAGAEQAAGDRSRFDQAYLGYIDDVMAALEWFPSYGGDQADDRDGADHEPPSLPVTNPWRHVGRNDPCPCGSGKKAKRCCLAA